jgi:hypothetical protein
MDCGALTIRSMLLAIERGAELASKGRRALKHMTDGKGVQ